ncbi:MAG: hypothetical protein GY760_14110 [Deltaproteobacteria bacterium]|nr:hypothetical protein [Deltaproteobacteria bacterium]
MGIFSGILSGVMSAGQIAQIISPFFDSDVNESSGIVRCGPIYLAHDDGLIAKNVGTTEFPNTAQIFVGDENSNFQFFLDPNEKTSLPIDINKMSPNSMISCFNAGPVRHSQEMVHFPASVPTLSVYLNNLLSFKFGVPITVSGDLDVNVKHSMGPIDKSVIITVLGTASIAAYTVLRFASIKYTNGSVQRVQNVTVNIKETSENSISFDIGKPPSYTGSLSIDSINLILEASKEDKNAYNFREEINKSYPGKIQKLTDSDYKIIEKYKKSIKMEKESDN